MGDSSGGDSGSSKLTNLKDLLQKSKEKFVKSHPNDKRWPCPFCIILSKTKIQIRIHIANDHPNIFKENLQDFSHFLHSQDSINSTQSQSKEDPANYNCPFPNCKKKKPFTSLRGLNIHIGKIHDNIVIDDNPDVIHSDHIDLVEKIAFLKSNTRILKRIPKGARTLAAKNMTTVIDDCVIINDTVSWEKLLLFSFTAFRIPKRSKSISLTAAVKMNLNNLTFPLVNKEKFKESTIEKRVEAKIANFDTRGAVKILTSNESFAENNEITFAQLQSKHPAPSRFISIPEANQENEHLIVNQLQVREGISSFYGGSAGGIDGLLPQHLKDITAISACEPSAKVLESITNLCNLLLGGKVNPSIIQIFYGASLCAFKKKNGGIRPIAIGNVFRRLTAKLACTSVRDSVGEYLRPKQVGFGTRGSCEAAIHATRSYVTTECNSNKILLKIDYSNAFNSMERDSMLSEVKENTPLLYSFLQQCYGEPSLLFYGDKIILSQVGAQQGDPTGPMIFSLGIQPIINTLHSDLNIWYLDDGTLCDIADIVLEDFRNLITKSKEIGLEINADKCELFFCSGVINQEIVSKFQEIAPGINIVEKVNLNLLGSPIFEEGFYTFAEKQFEATKILFSKLTNLSGHYAYHLLKNCFCIPKFTYFMRTFPLWRFNTFIEKIDNLIKSTLEQIFNIKLNNKQWIQASLPIKFGGIGIRSINDLCIPAYISSSSYSSEIVSKIMKKPVDNFKIYFLEETLEAWDIMNNGIRPKICQFQKNWDYLNIQRIIENEMKFENQKDTARFLALQTSESGAWLHAIPSPHIGTFFDNQSIRISVALRLGCLICHQHVCNCGEMVDEMGRHGLSCSKNSGCVIARHSDMNNIIHRSLSNIHVPSILEPPGLFREDGKHPDGMSLIPWSRGKCLVWDATCVDTFASSYIHSTSTTIAGATRFANNRKNNLYKNLIPNYFFVPLAVETMGPWSKETKDLMNKIGSQLIQETKDFRSKQYLFQRLSIAIQRGNVNCIMRTLPSNIGLEEIFYL